MELNEINLNIVDAYLSLFSNELPNKLNQKDKEKVFYALSHQEEKEITYRDQWGNWEYPFTKFDYRQPYLDYFIQQKLKELNLVQNNLWPDNKEFAFCITHDVDLVGINRLQTSQRARTKKTNNFLNSFFTKTFNVSTLLHNTNKLWCYEKWTDFLNEQGCKSTFFFYINPENVRSRHLYDNLYELNDKIKFNGQKLSVATFIKVLGDMGFEIGLHGSYFSALDENLFKEQKEKLEQIIQKPITVTRQHFLRYNIDKTPLVHSANGILVDSTLGFNRAIGFRAGASMPYFMKTNEDLKLLEVPMHIMDGALFTTNALELNEELAIQKSIQVMEHCRKTGGAFVINFHPNYVILDKWWNVFKAIVFEAKLRNAYNTSLQGLYDIVQGVMHKNIR